MQRDFRQAVIVGTIEKITEDWKNGREYKIAISAARYNNLDGLKSFNGTEEMTFRVLPVQPNFNDLQPEEFGDKVPPFGVAMIERLEGKSCQGVNGWEKLTADEVLDLQVAVGQRG